MQWGGWQAAAVAPQHGRGPLSGAIGSRQSGAVTPSSVTIISVKFSAVMTATARYVVMPPIIAVPVSLPITVAVLLEVVIAHQRPQPDRPAWAR
jgi:hypothetical protein